MPRIDPTTPSGIQPQGFSSGFTLNFSDEFNSTSLDPKWRMLHNFSSSSTPSAWDLNNNNNSCIRMWHNGNYAATDAGHNDRCEMLASDGSQGVRFRYGYYEARIKQPRGKGFFPAFWVFDLGTQRELDFYECFAHDNGDTWVGQPGWLPTDAALHQWHTGGSQQNSPPDDQAIRRIRYGPPRGSNHPYVELDKAFHTYGCYWTGSVIRMYFDGVQVGHDLTPTSELGSNSNNTFVLYLDGWWGWPASNGIPHGENSSVTPNGSGNSLECDYIRVWDIGSATPAPPGPPPPPPPPPFSATLVSAPNDGATIAGNVFFRVEGNSIQNCELLPPTGYSPKYGTFSLFTLESGLIQADLNWDTTQLANGQIQVRISAFSSPPGGSGSELVPMTTRTYTINNLTPVPPPPPPPPEPPPPPPPGEPPPPPPPPAFDPDMQFCFMDIS